MKFLRPALALSVLMPACLAAASIYIAPTGNDANPGTATQPVATPQAARNRLRPMIAASLTEPVEVIFAAGIYRMLEPLELRPEDSGTEAFPITWKAAPGAKVVLSAGRPVTGTWTRGAGGVWRTRLDGTGLAPGKWNFRQLFVNGKRATRARFPNAGETNPFLYATAGGFDHVVIRPALIKQSWGTAADAQINIVPQSRFFNQWNTVTRVDRSNGRIDIANSERHRLIDKGSWFWIEGVREELDEPGEWFLDPVSGTLEFIPPPGADPNTLEIIAPVLDRLIDLKGDVNAGTHVSHVRFDGLEFRHTNSTLGHIEPRVDTDTVMKFENTLDCSVTNCHFENIGGYALWLHLDSRNNTFDRNTVRDSGGGGVLMTGARFAYMDDTKIYTPGEAAARVFPILNRITRNTVEHCGRIRYYGGGVHLDSRPFSMTFAPGNTISHNHFNDLSRNGIFAFRNQGGNVVEYNHIHNAMQTTLDGGCIHFATMNTLNAPNLILNNWLHDVWGHNRRPDGKPDRKLANGVFLDWDTSHTTVRDNWIHNSSSRPVKVIFGGNQQVTLGENPSSDEPITPPFAAEVGPAGSATHGILPATLGRSGSVIPYTDNAHFSLVPPAPETVLWKPRSAVGLAKLFEFHFLAGTAPADGVENPQTAVFTLPVTEDGFYQVSLLYQPGADRASNAPVAIAHADGTARLRWDMRRGSKFGFAVPLGTYRFTAGGHHTLTLGTADADGLVIADSVAFVKVEKPAE